MKKGKGAAGAADAVQVTQSVTDKEGAEVSFTGQGAAMFLYGRVGPEYGSVRVEVEGDGGDVGRSSTLNLTVSYFVSCSVHWRNRHTERRRQWRLRVLSWLMC